MIKKVFIFVFLFFCVHHLFAQTAYSLTNYTSKKGLSNSSVTGICIDSMGFLWVSTDFGFNKFDGKEFRKINSYNAGIPDNQITNINSLGNNKLFVTTGTSGFFVFDAKKNSAKKSINNFSSYALKVNKTIVHKNKVYILNNYSNKIHIYGTNEGKIIDSIIVLGTIINDFTVIGNDELIIATKQGLKICKNKNIDDLLSTIAFTKAISSVVVKNNKLFAASLGKIIQYDYRKNLVIDSLVYDSTLSYVNRMYVDKNDNLWFTTTYPSVLFCYELSSKQLRSFESFQSLTDNPITCIIEDIENNIWIGTHNKGLYKIARSVFVSKNILSNENIDYIDVDEKGNYYFGTKKGLEILYHDSTKATNVRSTHKMREYIYKVIPLKDRLLIAANSPAKDIKIKKRIAYQYLTYKEMERINDSLFVLGGWNNSFSLASYNYKKHRFSIQKTISLNKQDGDKNRVNCLYVDSKKTIWCGTDEGLYRYDVANDKLNKLENDFFNHKIIDVIEDDNGIIYVSTEKQLLSYTNENAVPIKEINDQIIEKATCFEKDNNGNIFIGTYNGLYKIRKSGYNEYYSEEDGLISQEINDITYNKKNNALLIATNEGLCELNLYLNKYISKHIPIIYIDSISSHGNVFFKNNYYHAEQRNLSIFFGSICYSKTNALKYKWFIDNGQEYLTKNSTIELAELSYGEHILEIYATNDGKNWSRPYFVRINIITPIYLTWWFLLAGIVTFILFLIFIIRYRIRKVRVEAQKKSDIEQKIVQLKYEALNAAINPHFIFNALSSVQHYIHMNKNDEASDYLAKFGHLIRQTLEMATLHFISIHDEVERLRIYIDLEQLRFENKFSYSINIDTSIDIHKTKIPNMILQPLIENSIIHGFKQIQHHGFIKIDFKKVGNLLHIIIDDNGSGLKPGLDSNIKRKDKTKSIAVQNIRDRIATTKGASIAIIDKVEQNKNETGVFIEMIVPLTL